MKMKKNMKAILHSHWDREWYFSVEETQIYLRYLAQNVFDYLQKNPDIKFLFDGQSIIIDDLCEYYEDVDRYKDIIKNQIDLGPWYTQTDLVLPKDESIVRNLYYGIMKARDYTDNPMLIGYAPDTFGHNPQMPQIYKGFGINSTIFWRGYSQQMTFSNIFDWVGIDGTQVKAISLPAGYQGAKYLPDEADELKKRIEVIINKYKKFGSEDKILLMNGHDQMPIQKNIKEIIEQIRIMYPKFDVEISDLKSYVNQYIGIENEKVYGYLDHGDFTRVHRTIGSTRMDIKMLNRSVEETIYEILEPLSLIAEKYNIKYPNFLIEKSLKQIMGCHAHDSLGGCNTDEVNRDIKHRILRVKRLVDNHIEITKRVISSSISEEYNIFIFNLMPYTICNEIVQVELLVDDLNFCIKDFLGNRLKFDILDVKTVNIKDIDRQILAKMLDIYKLKVTILLEIEEIKGFDVIEYKIESYNQQSKVIEIKDNFIEDENYIVKVKKNNLNLFIKSKNIELKNFITIENSGDDGDSYDYSPPVNDRVYGEQGFDELKIVNSKRLSLFSEMNLIAKINIPYNLESRLQDKKEINQEYFITIRLFNDGKIKVKLNFINNTIEQRTRLKVKSTHFIDSILAGCQYGYINIKNDYDLEEISVQKKWVEKAVNIYNFQDKLIHENNLSITAKMLNEFEYFEERLYLTLMRSFSFLGKSDLVNRPNRASGMNFPTPEARLLNYEFSFEIDISYTSIDLSNERKKLLSYQNKEFNRFNINNNRIEKKKFLIDLPFENVNISAIKKSELKDGMVFRVCNPHESKNIKFESDVYICDLLENEIEKVREFSIGKNEVKTIKIKMEGK